MANRSPAEVAARLRASNTTLQPFIGQYGSAVLDDTTTVLKDLGLAIAAYESEAPQFHPFSSKFDYWLAGKAPLSAQEPRGLALVQQSDPRQLRRLSPEPAAAVRQPRAVNRFHLRQHRRAA
jgi:cytochrome c peroxidase